MRIAILTLPFDNNYGGYLQAYALQTFLETKGHEVTIIDRRSPDFTKYTLFKRALKNTFKSVIKHKKYPLSNYFDYKGRYMHKFVNSYMHLSNSIKSSKDLEKHFKETNYEIVVVGSDQLWRPEYVPNVEDYFLGFITKRIVKISYACSFGTSNPKFSKNQIENCRKALLSFDRVSLREDSGIKVMNEFGWISSPDPVVVLDPTMLLPVSHYISLLEGFSPQKSFKGKLLTYVLDNDQYSQQCIQTISSKLKVQVDNIIDISNWKEDNYILPSIEDWLCAFRDAEYVLTDSFHGTVFSILFHKPFFVKVNLERGADRFETLLNHFDLSDRIIKDVEKLNTIIEKPIDWVHVDKTLENKQLISSRLFDNL